MTIQTGYEPLTYAGNGITNSFPITWPYQLSTDIVVQSLVISTGIITTLINGTDYTVTPFSNSPASTGTATTMLAVPAGTEIIITRSVPVTQLTHWVPNDPNPTAAIENGLDKLTEIAQSLSFNFLRSWYLPLTGVDGSSYFDARGNRGANMGNPVNPQDAVTLAFMQTFITALITTGSSTAPLDYEFVGDGSTVSFPMPGATVATTNGYFAWLDGIGQRPNADYTVTLGPNPLITFLSAPPSNVLISVRVLGYAQPITSGINGSAITSGTVNPARLGNGIPTTDTWLRGDSQWSNTLIGSAGAAQAASSGTVIADFQNNSQSAIRVTGAAGGQAGVWFGAAGAANPYSAAWIYDDSTSSLGFYGASAALFHQFATNGNVNLAGGALLVNAGSSLVSVPGTLFGFNITGNADGSLITSGQIAPARLASNFPSPGFVLGSGGLWVANGGGSGSPLTTTTGTFTVAAVASSQTVPVTSVSGLTVGAYIYVSDGTHTIQGQITAIVSLNLTVVTTVISAGSAGNTMATGATVGLGAAPGASAINIADAGTGSAALTTLTMSGRTSNVPAGGYQVDNYIVSNAGGNATVRGYLNANVFINAIRAASGPSVDQLGWLQHGTTTWGTLNAGTAGRVLTSDGTNISFGQVNAVSALTAATITAALLTASNGPTSGYLPAYNSGTGGFTWVAPGGGGLPGAGDTMQFLNGSAVYTNQLRATALNTGFQIASLDGTGVTRFEPNNVGMIVHMDTHNGPNDQNTGFGFWGVLIAGSTIYSPIDTIPAYPGVPVESFYSGGYGRANNWRADRAFWTRIRNEASMTSTYTLDLFNFSYYRLTGFTANCTFTVNDNSSLPISSSDYYAAQMYIEIVAPGSFTVSWPGNVTWANGSSAPTLSTSGTTLVRLIRRQGQTQWIGIVEAVAGAAYTDSQARAAVFNTAQFPSTATIAATVTTGASGNASFAVVAGSITATQLANASVGIAKLSATGTPSSSTYLRGDNTWAAIAGGGTTSPLTTKGDLWGFSTVNARVPIGLDGQVLTADSTQALGVKWASLTGGTFSPATSYAWTGGQAFNASNTHSATVLHTVNLPAQFTSGGTPTTAYFATGGLADPSLGTRTPIFSHIDNHAPASATLSTDYASQINAGTFWHAVYNPGQLMSSLRNVVDGRGNFTNPSPGNASFHLAFTSEVYTRQINKTNGNGTVDSIWFVATSPNSSYQSVADGQGVKHSFTAGTVRIGEVNYGNLWADFGLKETRGIISQSVVGMEFFPDALPGAVTGSGATNKFDATYALSISFAGAGDNGHAPQNWIGMLVDQNGITPGGYGLRLWGSNGTFNGASAATNAPAAVVKVSGTAQTGIDFAGTAHDSTILTATNTGAPVITMTDATQSIKLGSVWIRGNGGHLQYSTNGTSWTNIV